MSIVLLIIAPILSLIINLVLIPIIIRLSDRYHWYDYYDAEQKIHVFNTSRIGGLGMFVSFLLSLITIAIINEFTSESLEISTIITRQNILLLLGFLLIHAIGLVDDFRNIPAKLKLFGQIIAAVLVAFEGIVADGIYIPIVGAVIPFGIFTGVIVLIFWLVSVSNAVNIVDGVDGLVGSIALCASVGIGITHVMVGNYKASIYSFTLSGSIIAFLFYNKPLAQIFMGDSGSLFLGIAISSIVFVGSENYLIDTSHFQAGFILCITVLIVPIIEMIIAMINRIRKGQSIFYPDNLRYYHKLLNMGKSVQQIVGFTIVHSLSLMIVVILRTHLYLQGSAILGDGILILSLIISLILVLSIHYRYKIFIKKKGCRAF